MRIDQDGMSLWFGTADAPAPEGIVTDSANISLTVAVQPPDASNQVEVLYRIDGGPIQALPAKWFRNDFVRKVQYFRAQFPPLRAGDKVEYSAICRCAGRQIPSAAEVGHLASFRIASDEKLALRQATLLSRPVAQVEPVPQPNGEREPPPPDPTPDLALQISSCLPAELNGAITSAIQQALDDPSAEVRTACVNGTQRIGVWRRPRVSGEIRNIGLERLNIIGSGETLTFFINPALIRRQAREQTAKRLNANGEPDPHGPIHVTNVLVSFESPNRIITRVDGFDDRPLPDVDFRLTITDTLSLAGDHIDCDSKPDLDVDTSWLNLLTGVGLFVFPVGDFFIGEQIIIARAKTPKKAGAGCAARTMIPWEILLPDGQKVVASYSRLEVSRDGIFAGGSFSVISRSLEPILHVMA